MRTYRCACLAILIAGLMHALTPAQQTTQANELKFFTNYFLTGDYVVAGVGLRGKGGPDGLARDTITISGVPDEADIVAAFLYWQVVSKDSLGPDSGAVRATFDNKPLSSADGPFSKVLNRAGTAPCWSSGGGTGSSGGNVLTYTYRADVRRFLQTDGNDRIIANGEHVVQIPDSGSSGNGVPIALGASLVVVYRHPSQPFSAIVLYDGGLTLNNSNPTLVQTIKGFYQPATLDAKITYVVGSGQANKAETLSFNGASLSPPAPVNPFDADEEASWDTDTYPVTLSALDAPPPYGAAVTTTINTAGLSGADCLTPAMIGFKTEVQDTDGDGLLDIWEEPDPNNASSYPYLDPNDHPLPNLKLMGASATKRDLFIEIGYMKSDGDGRYATTKKPHTHLPPPEALKLVGDAFAAAPAPPDQTAPPGISVHFDVGALYPSGGYPNDPAAEPFIIRGLDTRGRQLSRGGEAIDETLARDAACGTSGSTRNCQFPDYPGTVGWKVGFRYFRDQLLDPPALKDPNDATKECSPGTPSWLCNDPCDMLGAGQPGNEDGLGQACERRFDRNRKDMFRYVLGAHFIGLPKSEYPCKDTLGNEVAASDDGTCTGTEEDPLTDNLLFHTPRTVSGVADFPGGDVMLTLGGFSDASGLPVGTPIQQAGTLMHELGHNFDLGHAGVYLYQDPPAPPEPNCNPNYPSVMNYLFQLRGLFKATGGPQLDYSWTRQPTMLDEMGLTTPLAWTGRYLTAWYAPESTSLLGSLATKHCTGSEREIGEAPMVRVDGPATLPGTIYWDSIQQDVNFDGEYNFVRNSGAPAEPLSAGYEDWNTLRLNQLATRRNVYGMSINVGRDGMGRGDVLGRDGMGRDGMGRDGMGRDGMGDDGLGRDGMGRDGMGRDGMGRDGMGGDGLGRDGMGVDWLNRDNGELDAETALAAGHIDVTAPTVTFSPAREWYNASVTLTVTATDPSRVTDISCSPDESSLSGIGTQSASGQVTATTSGNVSCTATDSAGNTTTATKTVNIEAVPPTITITTPAEGAQYDLNQAVTASYTCQDGVAGSGIATCVGTVPNGESLNTSSSGSKTFSVTATDVAGNTTIKSVSYSVGYKVTLYPIKTSAQLGSAVPVVWQVKDGAGRVISDLTAVSRLESVSTPSCTVSEPKTTAPLFTPPDFSTGKSTLRFVAPNFQFNWDTTFASNGRACYTVLIYMKGDPNPHMTTPVLLK